MRPCESSQRGVEEGAFVDCVLLPNFFHCCGRLTVNVVLCVTSSIAECGKIRLVLDTNFCVFSVLITTEKRGFTRNSITPFKTSPIMVPKCSVFEQKLLRGQTCVLSIC